MKRHNESHSISLTVVMAVNLWNPFLRPAIDSILSQTDPNFNFIIVANNCSDELWSELTSIGDTRIQTYRTRIGQLAFNLNFAANIADDDYIVRMDSDDVSAPTRIAELRECIARNSFPDLICSNVRLINESDVVIGRKSVPKTWTELVRKLPFTNCLIHPACAIRTKILVDNGGYIGGFVSEDYELWLRLSRNASIRFIALESCTLDYRIRMGQSRGASAAYAEAAGHLLKEALYPRTNLLRRMKMIAGVNVAIFKSFLRMIERQSKAIRKQKN